MAPAAAVLDRERTALWRSTWEAVMSGFVPGATALEQTVHAAAEATSGGPPRRVLDLGGGPGVFAERMARRWPGSAVTLLDLDPMLLALARAGVPPEVAVVDADLGAPDWDARTGTGFDLVTAVMTVHYLPPQQVLSLYAAAYRAVAPGGLLVVADLMPDDEVPGLMRALEPGPGEAAAELAWAQWWGGLAEVPECRGLMSARTDVFRDRPPAEFVAGPGWHAAAARAAGFTEAGILWRCGRYAALAAVRH